MRFKSPGNLVFCPGCGNIQNEGENCIKCGTFIAAESKEEDTVVHRETAHRTGKTKVSLMSRRKTKKPKTDTKETHRRSPKQTHPRKDRTSS
jgi:DNA-directed RNA polymerase subunit M/transcription elongation factor TFIIS